LAEIDHTERFLVRVLRATPHPKVAAVAASGLKNLREARVRKKLQDAVLRDLAARRQADLSPLVQKMDCESQPVAVQKMDEAGTSKVPTDEPVQKTDGSAGLAFEPAGESVASAPAEPAAHTPNQKLNERLRSVARAILGAEPSEADFDKARQIARALTRVRLQFRYAEEFARDRLGLYSLRADAERAFAEFVAENPTLKTFAEKYAIGIYEEVRCEILSEGWDNFFYNQRSTKRDLRLMAAGHHNLDIRRRALERIAPPTADREPKFNEKFLPDSRVVCEQNLLFMTANHPELPPETRKQAIIKMEKASLWLTTGGPYSTYLLQWIAFLQRNPASPVPDLKGYEHRSIPKGAFALQPYPSAFDNE
jgi:hypothetical protein